MFIFEVVRPNFSPAFLSWFRGSAIVDRNGDPLMVFHGTDRDFSKHDIGLSRQDAGLYFTPDTEYASGYANNFNSDLVSHGANVRPCYLSIKNPFFCLTKPTDIQLKLGTRGAFTSEVVKCLQAKGHDGVVVGVTDYEVEIGARTISQADEICAFSPNQVRSVWG